VHPATFHRPPIRPPADLKWKFACKSFSSLEQQLCEAWRLGEFSSNTPPLLFLDFCCRFLSDGFCASCGCVRVPKEMAAEMSTENCTHDRKLGKVSLYSQTVANAAPFSASQISHLPRLAAATARGYD